MPLLKQVLPVSTLARLMAAHRWHADGPDGPAGLDQILRTGGRILVSGNCLDRSLVIYRILSGAGANPRLILGVRKNNGEVAGHAWVELNGRPIHDVESATFEPIAVFGPDGLPLPAAS